MTKSCSFLLVLLPAEPKTGRSKKIARIPAVANPPLPFLLSGARLPAAEIIDAAGFTSVCKVRVDVAAAAMDGVTLLEENWHFEFFGNPLHANVVADPNPFIVGRFTMSRVARSR